MLNNKGKAEDIIRKSKAFSIASEYFISGVFTTDMTGAMPADEFTEMPPALRERLKAWQCELDDMRDANLPSAEFNSERIRLNAIGLELAQDAVVNMPDWKIGYYDVTIEKGIEMHEAMVNGRSAKLEL